MIIVVNKWDLVTSGEKRAVSQSKAARIQEARRPQDPEALYEERLRYGLKVFKLCAGAVHLRREWARALRRILPLIEEVAEERRKRVSDRRDESVSEDRRL